MKLLNADITIVPSYRYEEYYSLKTHLWDLYPNLRWFISVTKLKGIGKSYSVWNHIIVPCINNENLGAIYIRWSQSELNGLIFEIKEKPQELLDKINKDVEWNVTQGITILRDSNTKQPIIYFVTPSQFKVLKGITIQGNLPIKHVYWEEFLIPDNIYRKPEENLDAYFQLLGSMFRKQDFYQWMTANNVNPDNPFLWYIFTEMGWPNYGETILNNDAGVAMDSPIMGDILKADYEKTTFYRISKIKPTIHNQLFGDSSLYDSMYSNQDLIVYRLDEECNYKFNYKIKTAMFHVLTYKEPEFKPNGEINPAGGEWRMYITPQKVEKYQAIYAGDALTAIETTLPIIPRHLLRAMFSYAKQGKLKFKDKRTLDLFVWMNNINKFDDIRQVDWDKKE